MSLLGLLLIMLMASCQVHARQLSGTASELFSVLHIASHLSELGAYHTTEAA